MKDIKYILDYLSIDYIRQSSRDITINFTYVFRERWLENPGFFINDVIWKKFNLHIFLNRLEYNLNI